MICQFTFFSHFSVSTYTLLLYLNFIFLIHLTYGSYYSSLISNFYVLIFFSILAQSYPKPFCQFTYYITHLVVSCILLFLILSFLPVHGLTNNPQHFIFSHYILKYISNHSVNSFFSHTSSFSHALIFFTLTHIYLFH